MDLNKLAKDIRDNAVAHGFADDRNFGEIIALIHSEASEALEEWRNGHKPTEIYYHNRNSYTANSWPVGVYAFTDEEHNIIKPEGIPIELADIIIRVLNYCGAHNIDIEYAITTKMAYNSTRPYKHGREH